MAKIRKLVETGKPEQVVPVQLVHVLVQFCFWWVVPVQHCSCTGTTSIFCPDFVISLTFDANSLHITSIIHNTSKTNLEFI